AKQLEVVSFIQPKRGREGTSQREPTEEPRSRETSRENTKEKDQNKKIDVPKAVLAQQRKCRKYKYTYKVTNEGNVINNTILYLFTELAHQSNVVALFQKAIQKAKTLPEFGENFECEVRVNLVKRHNGAYVGYAYVHLTNPMLYHALLGMNVDGTERVVYEDVEVKEKSAEKEKKLEQEAMPQFGRQLQTSNNWSDYDDDDTIQKKKIQLPPLLTLEEYEYDEMQKDFAQKNGKPLIGEVTVLPAFIEPGVAENENECILYVTDVPAMDYDLLYSMFAPYATNTSYSDADNSKFFYPKINIRQTGPAGAEQKIFATVKYDKQYDASFALQMNRKVHLLYSGKEVTITTRRAYRKD
ncbi:MAG: hypothetical protein Solivirus9_1, partial [Solivirus sp.]